jgi:hypothetical protein
VPEAEVTVVDVKAIRTKSGNTRFVVVDDAGNEYSTFKESVAASLPGLKGRRARIIFHEQERNGFTNVYLDSAEPIGDEGGGGTGRDVDEVAWKTAMDAAPYLLSAEAVEQEVPLRRIGRPDDVAGLTIFLASRAGSYLTGTVIPLDGGITGCN